MKESKEYTIEESLKISEAFDGVKSYHSSIPLMLKDYFMAGVEFGKIEGFNEGIETVKQWYIRNSLVPSIERIKEIEKLKKPFTK